MRRLGVGIIGASAQRGWAKESHVPAVQALEGLRLVATAGTTQSSAEAAAEAFGAERAYGDVGDLINDRDIDVVSIAVRVPAHRVLVLKALDAGKHVYCAWPLGRDARESEDLARAARHSGVRAAIGLQARATLCCDGPKSFLMEVPSGAY